MLKTFSGLILGLLKVFILVVLVSLIFHHQILRRVVISSLEFYLKTSVEIGEITVNWSDKLLTLEDIRVNNPYGFPSDIAFEVKKASFKVKTFWDSGEFRMKWMLEGAHFEIQQVSIMRRVSGHLNIFSYPISLGESKAPSIFFSNTRISLAKVIYTDLSGPTIYRHVVDLQNREFPFHAKYSPKWLLEMFASELLGYLGQNQENDLQIPLPEYRGYFK